MAEQLENYIREALAKGYNETELRNLLRAQGWTEDVLDQAFARARVAAAPTGAQPVIAMPTTVAAGGELTPVVDLFKKVIDSYVERIVTFIGVGLMQLALMIPIGILVAILIAVGFVGFLGHANRNPVPYVILIVLLAIAIIAAAIFVGAWVLAAMLTAVKDGGEGVGVIESYRRAWERMPAMVVATILQALCILGGFVLFVIPAVIIGVWLSLAAVVVVAEKSAGVASLGRSKSLVEGRWWDVFARLLLLFIGMFVVYFVPTVILQVVLRTGLAEASILFFAFSNLFQWALNLVLAPLAYVFLYELYVDLRRVKG